MVLFSVATYGCKRRKKLKTLDKRLSETYPLGMGSLDFEISNLLASSKFNSNCLTISELFAAVQNNVDSHNIFCAASCIQLHVFFLDSYRSIRIFFALLGSHLLFWSGTF